jgi:hypothetical protein
MGRRSSRVFSEHFLLLAALPGVFLRPWHLPASRMSETANISESEAGVQCPACKKPLLSRSARLCVFCGEKLPDHLLLPLAEVRRQEQQSQEAVHRVLAAYGARNAEIIERSQHLTHAGVFFEDSFRDTLYPDVAPDEWALHELRRTLKLPDDDFDARRHKRAIDDRLRKLCSSLASRFAPLDCKVGTDQAGHLSARLTGSAIKVMIQTQFGNNATFTGGAAQMFRCYSIRAEAQVPALSKADAAGQRLRVMCMLAGMVAVPAGFVWLAYRIATALGLELIHRLWLNETGVTVAALLGAWVGRKAGTAVAGWVDKRTISRAEAEGVLPRIESLWSDLTEAVDDITREYESV